MVLLGYRSYGQSLPGPELLIELKISPAALGEVQVTGSVEGIVREAVARIPRNYPVRATQLTGFYRESDNDSIGRPRYLMEGLLTMYKPDYRQPADDGYVRIRQARKVDLRPAGQAVRIDWAGGSFIAQFNYPQTAQRRCGPTRERAARQRLAVAAAALAAERGAALPAAAVAARRWWVRLRMRVSNSLTRELSRVHAACFFPWLPSSPPPSSSAPTC